MCVRLQGDELAPRMRDALLRGKLGITALSPRVTTGKEQWQEWHHDFFHNQMEGYIQVSRPLKHFFGMSKALESLLYCIATHAHGAACFG